MPFTDHLRFVHPLRAFIASLTLCVAAAGCGGSGGEGDPGGSAGFEIGTPENTPRLIEGDEGISITLDVRREAASADAAVPLTLSVEGASTTDSADVVGLSTSWDVAANEKSTDLTLRLDIADRPIRPTQRRFTIIASDGTRTTRTPLLVDVEPVDAPDVYVLLGQSNMVGSSGEDTRRAAPGEPDAPDPRIRQLNVSPNDPFGDFADPEAFRSPEKNVVAPTLVMAEDPLHIPVDPARDSGKGFEFIGPGLSFAKAALADTTRDIILVPAAWSGSAFCANENGPRGQWNALPSDNPVLGNTLLFERALLRVDTALAESGGILRGILWHQGESDANTPCAALYAENMQRLVAELRRRILPDPRGPALRSADAPIPFVAGTMSRGVDERGDFSTYNAPKQRIDQVHRDIGSLVPHAAVSIHDDLTPANGFPCGNQDCIHFGAEALREMGVRYYAALLEALGDAGDDTPDVTDPATNENR